MVSTLRSLFVAALACSAFGCTTPCAPEHKCAVINNESLKDRRVCDGKDWRACASGEADADAPGTEYTCPQPGRTVVCTPNGWTFQNLK
jgi:hypothetical protein